MINKIENNFVRKNNLQGIHRNTLDGALEPKEQPERWCG